MPGDFLVGITTFNPTTRELRGALELLARSGHQAVIHDNSTTAAARDRVEQLCREHGLGYRTSGENCGTAGALNELLAEAQERGMDWLLYFDQDSTPDANFFARTYEVCSSAPGDVALIGCDVRHRGHDASLSAVQHGDVHEARLVIASGTVMRVRALTSLGGFDRSFFVDLVDHEMCLRARSAGFLVQLDPGRQIGHDIGEGSKQVLGDRLHIARHPWWRREQMWQNSVVLIRRYGTRFPREMARHAIGRAIETLVSTVYFRDARYLSSAAAGIRRGLSTVRPDGRGSGEHWDSIAPRF